MKTTKITQKDQVVNAVTKLGGIATLSQIYKEVNTSRWGTKTPDATIRRIVQLDKRLRKIKLGLYCLAEKYEYFKKKYNESLKDPDKQTSNHSYYQGLLLNIGSMLEYETYVARNDRNKSFLESNRSRNVNSLGKLASLREIYEFGYPRLIKKHASTVDVIWFNKRKMPCAFFEVEMSTDMRRSLEKFVELQDFYASFFIVAPKNRKKTYKDRIKMEVNKDIRKRVRFISTEHVNKWAATEAGAKALRNKALRGMLL